MYVLTLKGDRLNEFNHIHVWSISRSRGESPLISSYDNPASLFYTLLYMVKAALKLIILRMRGVDFDVVSVHFATEAFVMQLLRRILGWPYVFVMEGYTSMEAREAKYANAAVAISNDIARKCELAQGFRPLHIPIGVDRSRFSPTVDGTGTRSSIRRSGERLVLSVCRLDPRKDLPSLILAMQDVCRKMKARLLIIGDGMQRGYLEELIEKSRLSGRVFINSSATYEDLPEYYRAADVFALPTLYEGLGIVFLEAMSCEIPIVSTTVDGVTEIVGSAGLLVPPRDPLALTSAIIQVLTDDELRKTLIEKGRRRVANFDWEPIVRRYESVYEHVARAFRHFAPETFHS